MSGTPPARAQRRPLHERSGSQSNTLAAIRIVPYSPPRPLSITSCEQSAAPHLSGENPSGDDHQTGAFRAQSDDSLGKITHSQPHYASDTGSPSTSGGSRRLSLPLVAARGRGVSGSHLRSEKEARRSSLQSALIPDRVTTASPTPDDAQDISQLHASSHHADPTNISVASPRRPPSRRRNFITVNSGRGTFSLQPQATLQSQSTAFKSPSLSLSLSTQSSFERLSDLFSNDGRPSTPLSTLPERTPSPCTLDSSSTRLVAGEHFARSSSSPWNYRLVGGLRKVPATPDPNQYTASSPSTIPPSPSDARQSYRLSNAPAEELEDSHSLLNKTSFQSSQSASTASENTNYKVYGASSPAPDHFAPDNVHPPSSSDSSNLSSNSNYQVLARSSPAPLRPSIDLSPPKTADSDTNFIVHGKQSPVASSVGTHSGLRSQYSRESLLVPPLKPVKQKLSFERLGPYKSRSRESFRKRSLTSINSIIGQEAIQAFLATPLALRRPSGSSSFAGLGPDPWATSSSDSIVHKAPMQAHPHQWSSQLSTVHSESEGGSEPASRSVSPLSAAGWRSAGYPSNHSRHMLSISSSLAAHDDSSNSRSQSLADSLERPQPALCRGATVRLVRDHDEHGDGLGELRDIHHPLHQRPSRRRLASLLSSSSSDRNLHSSGSSRSNSFNASSIPTWARLYYGSGERRWLRHAASSESMTADFNDTSRPSSSFRTGSPSAEHLPLNIYSPRRRPREVRPPAAARPASDAGSLDISPMPVQGVPLRSTMRKQTSSIWSPHLGRDQRASGYSIWEPPSVDWSTESGPLGRRNVQVVLFIIGFILPLAWMAGSFLPLPPKPMPEMLEQPSDSLLDVPRPNPRQHIFIDERQYYNARWWRNLNRIMAVVGLLVAAAIIALVVVSLGEGWGT